MKKILTGIKRLLGLYPVLTKEHAIQILNDSAAGCTSQWFDHEAERRKLTKFIEENFKSCNFGVVIKCKKDHKMFEYRFLIFVRGKQRWRYERMKRVRRLV